MTPEFQAEVLASHVRLYGYARHAKESYNHFISTLLPMIVFEYRSIVDYTLKDETRHEVSIGHMSLGRPCHKEPDGSVSVILPEQARVRQLDYVLPVLIDIEHKITSLTGNVVHTYREVPLFDLPVMVKSDVCFLSSEFSVPALGFDDSNFVHTPIAECPKDEGGYFIIGGLERSLITQETLFNNRLFVFAYTKDPKYAFVCEVRSRLETKIRSTSTLKMFVSRPSVGATAACFVRVPYFDKVDIPVAVIFRLLGLADRITEFAGDTIHVADMVQCPMMQLDMCTLAGELTRGSKTKDDPEKHMQYILTNELLPHVGVIDGDKHQQFRKAVILGIMVKRLVRAYTYDTSVDTRVQATGTYYIPEVDDRDDYANKQLLCAGYMTALRLRQLFRRFQYTMAQNIKKLLDARRTVDIVSVVKQQRITSGLLYAFRNGNWNVQHKKDSQNVGITQIVSRMSHLSLISQIGRVNNASHRDGKVTHPRQAHVSHWGVICPNETPEGATCGFVKNLTVLAHVRVGTARSVVESTLFSVFGVVPFTPWDAGTYPLCLVFLNGDVVGTYENGDQLVQALRNGRRRQLLPFDMSVVRYTYGVGLHCDSGCLMRPLFVADALPQLATFTPDPSVELWDVLLRMGVIEYVSKDEEAQLTLCGPNATHMEIHPHAILGVSALHIPFANHNQAPRNIYQASMGKQAVAVPSFSFRFRMDAQMHTLDSMQHALVRTGMEDQDLTTGMNVVVAVMTLSGENQEDSLIFNQAFLDRGGMRSTYYTTYDAIEKTNGTDPEVFEHPRHAPMRQNGDVSGLDDDGRAELHAEVGENTVLIGKTVAPRCKVKQQKRDESVMYTGNDAGRARVDRVVLTSEAEGHNLQRVRVRSHRVPVVGDKFCLTADTDVLTSVGWVQIDEVTTRHLVAVRTPDGGLAYHHPFEVVCFGGADALIAVGGPGCEVDLLVTPDHRMCVSEFAVLVRAADLVGIAPEHTKKISNLLPDLEFRNKYQVYPSSAVLPLLARCIYFYQIGEGFMVVGRNTPESLRKTKLWSQLVDGFTYVDGNCVMLRSNFMLDVVIDLRLGVFPECVWKLSQRQSETLLAHLRILGMYEVVHARDALSRLQVHAGKCGDVLDERGGPAMVHPPVASCKPVYCLRVPGERFYVRRNGRCVWTGNSSRHGQKGTIGRIVPACDMPFSLQTGMVPDIVMNPCALPSRMTIAQLLECVVAKTGAMLGKFGDGRAFRDVSVDALCDALHTTGFERHGNERMVSGITGELLDATIFMGLAFYQRLRHMTYDKIHSRTRGPCTILTRQPTEGRSNNGGLRMGEMERDCLVSHGASEVILERFLHSSDTYTAPMCRACGRMGVHAFNKLFGENRRGEAAQCFNCEGGDMVDVTVPYAYKLTLQEMGAMGIAVSHTLETV